jgi:hypothetical protein
MNRQQIRDLARKRLGETTAAFWSDDELNQWINDGCRDVAYRTKCLKTNELVSPADDTPEYVLSSLFPNISSITEVYYKDSNDQWEKLIATSRLEMDSMFPGWLGAQSSDSPTHYWWDREDDIFYIYPSITTTEANSLRVFYTIDSTNLGTDAETPGIPSHLHLSIVDFIVATGFETRGWSEKANDAWAKYQSRLRDYSVERGREREDDNLIMRNYRN